MPKALYEAWEINVRDDVVDTELSLLGEKPKFGNHGNRRKADRVACETMEITGSSIGDINDHFGNKRNVGRNHNSTTKGAPTGIRELG